MPSETRYMRNALSENVAYPSSYNILAGSLSSGTLANLQASDNVYMVFASALVGANQEVDVEFFGTHSGHMPFLQELVELHGSVAVNLQIQAWNYDTGAYETTGTMGYSGTAPTSDVNRYLYHILGNRAYRDASGNWRVRVRAWTTGSPAPSFSLYIDYLRYRTVAFQLGTTQTTAATSNDVYVDGLTVGIRVWRVNSDDTETEITAGSPVATVVGPSSTTTLSATWTCPATSDVVAVMVGVYRDGEIMKTADFVYGGLPLLFITEDLNTTLLSAQWTVYYAFYYNASYDETYFQFGSSTYNSRIANFTWGVVAVAVKKPIVKMDLGPHPRSRLLFAPTLMLKGAGAPSVPPSLWDGWDYLWVAVL